MRSTLETTRLRLHPGVPTTLAIEVVNTSDVIDGVTATVFGLDPSWVRMDPPVVTLFPEGVGHLTLIFNVPTACPAGDSVLLIRVASTLDADRHVEHDVWITVDPVESAEMQLRPSLVVGGSEAAFNVELANTGNIATELTLSVTEPTSTAEVLISPPAVVVQPQQAARALVEISARRPWFGTSVNRTLQISATSPTLTVTQTARFTQKPRIPRGVLTAVILAGIIALWAFVFLFVVQLLRSGDAPAKAVPANWNEGGTREVNLADVAGVIEGSVTATTTGEGMPRITVEAHRVRTGALGDDAELTASAATGDDGTYALGALLPGNYRLRFSAEGFDPQWFPGVADEGGAEIITVNPLDHLEGKSIGITGKPGVLEGKVSAPEGADPSQPAKVTVTLVPSNPNEAVPPPVTVETTGEFSVPDLATPATYQVRVEREGFDTEEFEVDLGGGQNSVIDTAQLDASDGSIAGTVTDAGGSPLGDVTVTVRSGSIEQESKTPTVGNVGVFQIDNLPTPGTYVLTFAKEGYSETTIALDLAGGESRSGLSATLVGGAGTVRGTVRDEDGNPIGGVAVRATRGSVTATTTSLTTGDGAEGIGSFRIADLPVPGLYTITFSLAGYGTETTTVGFLSPGEQSGIDIVLKPVTGTVNGVIRVGGGGRGGLTVELSDGETKRTTQTATSPSGAYEFAGVPPGSYMMRVFGASISDYVVIVDVTAGGTVTRDVDVPT